MYNDRPSELVTTANGAQKGSIQVAQDGIVTRGVLLDVPAYRGTEWLNPGDEVTHEDLIACETEQGVTVGEGDALLVYTGRDARRAVKGSYNPREIGHPGLQASCLPWLHSCRVALLGSDVVNDVMPSGYSRMEMPIHVVGMVAMGLWLLDNVSLERLAVACREQQRWEFLFVISPLRLANATGSPVNPVALL